MSNGANNFKGLNSQAWAGMSLFLQNIHQQDFSHIIFEGNKLEDFCLVFTGGKKIICESKASNIGYSNVRNIVQKVIDHQQLNPSDDLLIICESVDKKLKNDIDNLRYFDKQVRDKLKNQQHKYTDAQINLLPQVKFWEVNKEINYKTVSLLVANLLRMWVPEHIIGEIVCNLMVVEVYFGSECGKSVSKQEFIQKLEDRTKQFIDDNTYRQARADIVKKLKIISDKTKNNRWTSAEISILSSNPNEFSFALSELIRSKNLDLEKWDQLFEAAKKGFSIIELFKIFENNVSTTKNQEYFLNFGNNLVGNTINFFRDEFVKTDITRICKKIREKTHVYDTQIFELLKKLYLPSFRHNFYIKQRDDTDKWETEEVSKLLKDIYLSTKIENLKKSIIEYIYQQFNLVEDEGNYWHHTPNEIFDILRAYYDGRIDRIIKEFVPIISQQFQNYYKQFGKKLAFDGWEHIGGLYSNFAGEFSISDRHFIAFVIEPIIKKAYEVDANKTWKYINSEFILGEKHINKDHPDFLNRAAIPILVSEYSAKKNKNQAFQILCDFIKSRRGIPHKCDLVFQEIKRHDDISDEDKWKLVSFAIKEYGNLPVNVFIEKIVTDLSVQSYGDAFNVLKSWVVNPEYIKRQRFGDFQITSNIANHLDRTETYDKGIELFEAFIFCPIFKDKSDPFDTYDLAKNLTKIIETSLNKGLEILNKIYKTDMNSENYQVLTFSSINNIQDNKKLKLVFDGFLKPCLAKLSNKEIPKKIDRAESRENIVQFSEKLSKAKYYDDALWIINKFKKDPDPDLDRKDEFNYHKKLIEGDDPLIISSVRGWCAHVLSQFALLNARNHISEALDILDLFLKDNNFYVRYQACLPLTEFARNRRTILPKSKNEMFMKNQEARKIEKMAFDMLLDDNNQKTKALMKRILGVFGFLRGIDQKHAKIFVDIILNCGFEDVIAEVSPLLIYFALFRKNDFKEKKFTYVYSKDEYNNLIKFDDRYFKDSLNKVIHNGSTEVRSSLSWHFWKMSKEKREFFGLSYKYLSELARIYDHDVFTRIYHFIEDNFQDSEFGIRALSLWKKCIETEKPAIEQVTVGSNASEMSWWPFYYNGKILIEIYNQEGAKEFKKWLNILLDYPKEVSVMSGDLDQVVKFFTSKMKRKTKENQMFKEKILLRNPNFINYFKY